MNQKLSPMPVASFPEDDFELKPNFPLPQTKQCNKTADPSAQTEDAGPYPCPWWLTVIRLVMPVFALLLAFLAFGAINRFF